MKKIYTLLLILGMAAAAHATLNIAVNGVVVEDSEVWLAPSDTVDIGIMASNDHQTNVCAILGVLQGGPGTITMGPGGFNNVNPGLGSAGYFELDEETAGLFGMSSAVFYDLVIAWAYYPMPNGLVAGGALFHCEGPGDVILQIVDLDREDVIYDTLIIHQIPEPGSAVLLVLGGLLFGRRK